MKFKELQTALSRNYQFVKFHEIQKNYPQSLKFKIIFISKKSSDSINYGPKNTKPLQTKIILSSN